MSERWLLWVFAVGEVLFGAVSVSWAGDGVVALQSAAPSCRNDSADVYVDCGNGTVTDNRTGLVWLKNANCFGAPDRETALELVAGLADLEGDDDDDCGLSDGSSPGEWRLPTKSEWQAMTADAVALGCIAGSTGGPSITIDDGTGCWIDVSELSSFVGVEFYYWSSTKNVTFWSDAWSVNLNYGSVFQGLETGTLHVWPVRGGQ